MICPMDATDRKMLAVLQEEGRISNAALAERLHLSPSPCVLDRDKLGIPMTVFVELKVEGHSDRSAAAISKAINATPEIVAAHIVSGSADFLLEVAVADLAHYERVMFETLLKLPNVADVRSNFALRTVKAPGPLPL